MKEIDELIEKYKKLMFTGEDEIKRLSNELEQLKEQHKEDVVKAFISGGKYQKDNYSHVYIDELEGDEYYQQTHEKK